METLTSIGSWLAANGVTIVAILWCVEKILRLIDKITPETMKWDDNIADILARILTKIGEMFPVTKKDDTTAK